MYEASMHAVLYSPSSARRGACRSEHGTLAVVRGDIVETYGNERLGTILYGVQGVTCVCPSMNAMHRRARDDDGGRRWLNLD
jgi:hypothetical protein